jgi:glyoxylase-like metal-dependent hydrolase (beta-lactamase superfamily II)
MRAPRAWFLRETGRLWKLHAYGLGVSKSDLIEIPVVAYLVEHPTAGPILIDTGFHPSVAVDPKQNMGRISQMVFKIDPMLREQAVSEQLRQRGIEPHDVGVVVMSHLHNDHASAMSEFPQATFVFTDKEWESATAPRGQVRGYVRRHFDHAFDYRLLDFESPDAGSFASFARSFDLFGDGSVWVVFTPGHTAGHMSVVLRTTSREVLLAVDAAYMADTIHTGHMPAFTEDEHLFRRSLREIQIYADQTPDALIVPGHDIEEWRKLDAGY